MTLTYKTIFICIFSFSFSMLNFGMEEDASFNDFLQSLSLKNASSDPAQIKVEMGGLAAAQGDLESLKRFIDSSNVNVAIKKKTVFYKALAFAFKSKDETQYGPIFEYLFSQNAEIQNPVRGTTLSAFGFATAIASQENYMRPLEILLSKGAKPFISCTSDKTTAMKLCHVAMKGHPVAGNSILQLFRPHATTLLEAIECLDTEKVQQLSSPETIAALYKEGSDPLGENYKLYNFGIPESFPVFKILLTQGATPNTELRGHPLPGYTFMLLATQHALENGDMKLFELSLEHGGNPRYQAFPMAPSAIELIKIASHIEPSNPNVQKIRNLLNSRT